MNIRDVWLLAEYRFLHVVMTLLLFSNPISAALSDIALSSTGGTSLTIDADGLPMLVYHASSSGALQAVHCSGLNCQPHLHRR